MGFFTIIIVNIIQSPAIVLILMCVGTQVGVFEK